MGQLTVIPGASLRGRVRVPGDKSISHRALLFGALADGDSRIEGFLPSGDCLATMACLRALGVEIEQHGETTLTVHGRGLHGLRASAAPLDCVRSGTAMRLLAGILAGQPFDSILTGAPQLLRRPMRRVTEPLRAMGAEIEDTDGRAPLAVHGRPLRGADHTLSVASAQVKSALLLAGLFAEGPTTVREPGPSRDHTERMLSAMGAVITANSLAVTLAPLLPRPLAPMSFAIPGDISSAAFPLVAAALLDGSEVTIEGVGVNPTRTGLLDVLREMGAEIAVENAREQCGEPVADVTVRASSLRGVEIGGDMVVRMIDEFPILAVAATQGAGATVVCDAGELRAKETDRIATVVTELQKVGACIEPLSDGFIVEGPTPLHSASVDSHGDHRLAMALAVAGMIAEGETVIENTDCIADSFPGFAKVMRKLGAGGFTTETQSTRRRVMLYEKELTGQIIGAAIEVHRELGPGLLESAYQACLARELSLRGLPFEQEKPLPLDYKGVQVDCGYRLDFLIAGKVVVELKAVDAIREVHEAQLLTYLKLTGCRVGLLINFNVPVLKNGIKRMVL